TQQTRRPKLRPVHLQGHRNSVTEMMPNAGPKQKTMIPRDWRNPSQALAPTSAAHRPGAGPPKTRRAPIHGASPRVTRCAATGPKPQSWESHRHPTAAVKPVRTRQLWLDMRYALQIDQRLLRHKPQLPVAVNPAPTLCGHVATAPQRRPNGRPTHQESANPRLYRAPASHQQTSTGHCAAGPRGHSRYANRSTWGCAAPSNHLKTGAAHQDHP